MTYDRSLIKKKIVREHCIHCNDPILYKDPRGFEMSSVLLDGGAKQPGLAHKDCHDAQT